jgi:hypothetical protein
VSTSELDSLRDRLVPRSRLPDLTAFVVPGQFTRSLWQSPTRTPMIVWYVAADSTHPTTLDRNLLMAEAPGNLDQPEFANDPGLLVIVPTSNYFDAIGDVVQWNVMQARAWIPWDTACHQLRMDAIRVFPFSATLYDHERFTAAKRTESVAESGPQRVKAGDLLLRALALQPGEFPGAGEPTASITYDKVWLPSQGQVRAWIALHPRYFQHAQARTLSVRMEVAIPGRDHIVHVLRLDPMNKDQQTYQPVEQDPPSLPEGQRGAITIRVLTPDSPTEMAEVLAAEPRVVQP